MRADRGAGGFELGADRAVVLGAEVVEGEAGEGRVELAEERQVLLDPLTPPRSVVQLGLDDRGQADLPWVESLETATTRGAMPFRTPMAALVSSSSR